MSVSLNGHLCVLGFVGQNSFGFRQSYGRRESQRTKELIVGQVFTFGWGEPSGSKATTHGFIPQGFPWGIGWVPDGEANRGKGSSFRWQGYRSVGLKGPGSNPFGLIFAGWVKNERFPGPRPIRFQFIGAKTFGFHFSSSRVKESLSDQGSGRLISKGTLFIPAFIWGQPNRTGFGIRHPQEIQWDVPGWTPGKHPGRPGVQLGLWRRTFQFGALKIGGRDMRWGWNSHGGL